MNYLCTWLCSDPEGEDSEYAQMKLKGSSTSSKFLNVYWKNIFVLFFTARKFNPNVEFILFTNTALPKAVAKANYPALLDSLGVKVVQVDFEYRTPEGYHGSWRNTFFEFSVFKKMLELSQDLSDMYLLLDSDCVVTQSLDSLWESVRQHGIINYRMEFDPGRDVNGLSNLQAKEIYSELLQKHIEGVPPYYGGELFVATMPILKKIYDDFKFLWPELLERNKLDKLKFNTEEHTLNYLLYKNDLDNDYGERFIKRLWTQPFIFRNVEHGDENLCIWHMPHEKKYGILDLFDIIVHDFQKYRTISKSDFIELLKHYLTVPSIPLSIYVSRIIPVQVARKVYYFFKNLKK